jgi:hypothetical protein
MKHPAQTAPVQALTPEQTARVEQHLALLALDLHKPILAWETGPEGARVSVEICCADQMKWPCETGLWVKQRTEPRVSGPAATRDTCPPDSPAPATASNGYRRDQDSDEPDEGTEDEPPPGLQPPFSDATRRTLPWR